MSEPIVMPKLGTDMTDATLLNWIKEVGDEIKVGDVIAEVETDKVTVEVESPVAGTIIELSAEPGAVLQVGAVIGQVGQAGEAPEGNGAVAPARRPEADAEAERPAPPPAAPALVPKPVAAPPYSPLPSGPDVEIIELSRMRDRIGKRMTESKQQVPHFYVTAEMDVDELLALRKQLNEGLSEEEKISVNDLVVKAAALTLRQFPNLNSHYYGDKIVRHKRIHIGMAVALPQGGLINVVAKDADRTALGAMAAHNKQMIAHAREGKVKPEDIKGSTFTISNLGSYDVEHFIAVINPPEAGILAVGSATKTPIVKDDGTVGVSTRMKVTISADHRVSDGAEGAAFMKAFKELIENPLQLVI